MSRDLRFQPWFLCIEAIGRQSCDVSIVTDTIVIETCKHKTCPIPFQRRGRSVSMGIWSTKSNLYTLRVTETVTIDKKTWFWQYYSPLEYRAPPIDRDIPSLLTTRETCFWIYEKHLLKKIKAQTIVRGIFHNLTYQ